MSTLTPFRSLDPFRTLTTRDIFGEVPHSLWNLFLDGNGTRGWDWTPRFDVVEQPDAYVFQAELPGMKAEDVDVTLTGDLLMIKGEKHKEEVREEDHYQISERSYGAFERSFTIPSAIDGDSLDAEMKDGVLNIKLAKTNEGKPAKIKVKSS